MKFFNEIFNVFTKAAQIRNDEERRAKSFGFAVTSIVCSALSVLFAVLFGLILKNFAGDLGDILRVVLVVILAACVAVLLVTALIRVIAQFTINRKIMSWIALIFFILATAASILFIIASLS